MNRVLIFIQRPRERALLKELLSQNYAVIDEGQTGLSVPFDLCILDFASLRQFKDQIVKTRAEQGHVFLPFLLIVPRRLAAGLSLELWENVDELIFTPIEKIELRARVESLLKARGHSVDLQLRNDDLEAFVHAMTHDLRAPARSVRSFARAIFEDQKSGLDDLSRQYLSRIETSADDMLQLISALLNFVRLERRSVARLHKVNLHMVIEKALRELEEDIQSSGAIIEVKEPLPDVLADPSILKNAITGLLTNALKYVKPGISPIVTITAVEISGMCRITIQDNGIGISEEDQQRIFQPFVRLHGVEDYAGIGLGLPSVAKMVQLLGGRVGVSSSVGEGSTFWIELNSGAELEVPNH